MKNFQQNFIEKKNFLHNNFFSLKSCLLWGNVEKYGKASEAADNIKTGKSALHAG